MGHNSGNTFAEMPPLDSTARLLLTCSLLPLLLLSAGGTASAPIDRAAVVARHDVLMAAASADALDTANDVFSLGNGAFAFSADASGLQSLNGSYTHLGVNTFADWQWHSEPFAPGDATRALREYNFTLYATPIDGAGATRQVPYMNDGGNRGDVTSWMMQNPHRLNLGQLSLRWQGRGAAAATEPLQQAQFANASQALRLWVGALESNFSLTAPQAETCSLTEDNFVASFGCPAGATIAAVPFASYGQPTGSCASGFSPSATCGFANSSAVMAAMCVGKPACSFLVNYEAGFGDPCPGQAKRLAANITCSAAAASSFSVAVRTVVHPDVDLVSASVACPDGPCPLALRLAFPYGTGAFGVTGADWEREAAHTTTVSRNATDGASFVRELDSDSYRVDCAWPAGALVALRAADSAHAFDLAPPSGAAWTSAEVSCLFSPTAGAGGALKYPVGEVSAAPWIAEKRAATQALLDAPGALPLAAPTSAAAADMWAAFWSEGAFVDLAGAANASEAFELERRIVLSLYLLRVNDAGAEPPQETGLLANSWNGKHHNEMRLWHQGWAPLWARPELLARSDAFFFEQLENASSFAAFEGYAGAHWPKETAAVANGSAVSVPWAGLDHAAWPFGGEPNGTVLVWESAQVDNALVLWQQPHVIFLAELQRRAANASAGGDAAALAAMQRLAPLVFSSADYLASRAYFNESDGASGRWWLGPPLMGGQEGGDAARTYNPLFELVYTAFTLDIASEWRAVLGLPPNPSYAAVAGNIAALPLDPAWPASPANTPLYSLDVGCVCYYLPGGAGNALCDKKWLPAGGSTCGSVTSHPLLVGAFGLVNGLSRGGRYGVDKTTSNSTVAEIIRLWPQWTSAWGWDDGLLALSMTRLGWAPEAIVAILLDPKFPFYKSGQTLCCPTYLPGNGGLLLAVAMIGGGTDSSPPCAFPSGWSAVCEGFDVPFP